LGRWVGEGRRGSLPPAPPPRARPAPPRLRGGGGLPPPFPPSHRRGGRRVSRRPGDSPRRPSRHLHRSLGEVREEHTGAGSHPARAGQSPLVLGRGAGGAPGLVGRVRRRPAYAPGGDGLSEGVLPPP